MRFADTFLVVIQTDLHQGGRDGEYLCPIVVNVSSIDARSSAQRMWDMAGTSFLKDAAFYAVKPGSYLEFGVSAKPVLNQEWWTLPTPQVCPFPSPVPRFPLRL